MIIILFPALLLGPTLARESTTCQGPGVTYTGTLNETKSGRTCQNWNETVPQRHTYTDVGDHNYCRNPTKSNEVGVWCYTTTKWIRWEKCKVPLCEESATTTTTTTKTTTTTTTETITTKTTAGTTEPAGSEVCHQNTAKLIFFSNFDYTCHVSPWTNVPVFSIVNHVKDFLNLMRSKRTLTEIIGLKFKILLMQVME